MAGEHRLDFRILSVLSAKQLLCSVQPAQLSMVALLIGFKMSRVALGTRQWCSELILAIHRKSYYQRNSLPHRSSSDPQCRSQWRQLVPSEYKNNKQNSFSFNGCGAVISKCSIILYKCQLCQEKCSDGYTRAPRRYKLEQKNRKKKTQQPCGN